MTPTPISLAAGLDTKAVPNKPCASEQDPVATDANRLPRKKKCTHIKQVETARYVQRRKEGLKIQEVDSMRGGAHLAQATRDYRNWQSKQVRGKAREYRGVNPGKSQRALKRLGYSWKEIYTAPPTIEQTKEKEAGIEAAKKRDAAVSKSKKTQKRRERTAAA